LKYTGEAGGTSTGLRWHATIARRAFDCKGGFSQNSPSR